MDCANQLTNHGSAAYDVSVVVPTYNRRSLLEKTLESLQAQVTASTTYEVIVVDNGSVDATRDVVEALSRQWPGRLTYHLETRRGVSYARNRGIEAARAPIVAFIDDDVEASPNWVETIQNVLDAHPEIDCVGGRIDPRWAAPPPSWLTRMFWGAVALQANKAESPFVDADHASPCLMTANFACRRNALQEVGGFSVDFLRDEDRELELRLWAAGKRGLYCGDIAVVTEVPCERLTKAYHREFFARVGRSHARMRFLDRIDKGGRLLREIPKYATLFGTPAFVYRSLLRHALGLVWTTIRLRRDAAFFHETRLRYFANYVRARMQDERRSVWSAVGDVGRLAARVVRNRLRPRAKRSANTYPVVPDRSVRS